MKKNALTRILSALMALFLMAELLPAPVFASDAELPEEDVSVGALSEVASAPTEDDADTTEGDAEEDLSTEEESPEEEAPSEEAPPTDEQEDPQQPEQEQPVEEIPTDKDSPSEPGDAHTAEEPSEQEALPSPADAAQSEEGEAADEEAEAPEEAETPEEDAEDEELSEEEAEALRQQAIMDQLDLLLLRMSQAKLMADPGFEAQLAQFPASYQPALKALHAIHPNWTFVAVNTGLDWNAAVNAEFGSRSTTEYNYGPGDKTSHLLLNNHSTYYSASSYASTNHYRPVDGRFVSTSRAAVAYYLDPRNFLTESYIFQFEDQRFNSSVEQDGVSKILLSGCNTSTGLAKITTYVTTSGKTQSLSALSSVYGADYPTVIYNVGKVTNVSPYFLASKIVQETSANTKSSVISGTVSGYVGYYNFYNIGSTASASGQAYINGLKYAKNHDWFNPIVALKGGAEFLADSYISKGQNTAYYMRFNVSTDRYYTTYAHQYMSALAASAAEGSKTASGYRSSGAMNSAFLFYIPVYKNMPDQTSTVRLTPTTRGKTTAKVTLFKEPSTTSSYVASVPSGTTVTILGGSVTSSEGYVNRLYYPYWYQVQVTVSGKSYTGYLYEQAVSVSSVYNLKKGSTKSIKAVLSTTGNAGTIYYETSDPTVATVSDSGVVTAVANGSCTVYAISGGGSFDAVGITVSNTGASSTVLDEPALAAVSNTTTGVAIQWQAVSGAKTYRVYRKTAGTAWSRIAEVTTTSYTDTTAQSGTAYTYTVRAFSGTASSTYNTAGLSIRYLKTPSLTSAKASSNGITVKWGQAPGAQGYYVYRKVAGGPWARLTTVSASSTSFLDCDRIVSGTTYYYTVRAYYGSQLSSFLSAGVSAKATVSSLATPVLKSAGSAANGVSVTWNAVSGAKSYRVYRKTAGTSWSRIAEVTTASYTDTAVANNTVYTYTVRAVSGSNISDYNAAGLTARYLKTPSLTSAKASSNGITVTWSKISGAQGYYLYRKVSGGSWTLIKTISSGSTVSYTDNNGLVSGTNYLYTVRAYYGSDRSYYVTSGISAKATATTTLSLATPALKSASNASSGVTVSWGAVSGAQKYRVYRKTAGAPWVRLSEVTTTSYTDTTAVSGSTYFYTVRALAGNVLSGFNTAGISTCYLKTPSLTSAAATSNGITVKWGKISGATGYYIYRKTSGSNWSRISQVTSGSTTSYTDNSGLTAGTTYFYTVRAYSGSYLSSFVSAGVSAKAVASSTALVNYVTTGMLNYRTGAGKDYSVAGTMAEGKTVQVVSGSGVLVEDTIWYKVLINGNYYYMSSKYLKKA